MKINTIIQGDCLEILKTLPDESVDCIVTSPPYWALRDYGVAGQLGNEETFYKYLEKLLSIFDEVKRVLKKSGTCFVNLGDTYSTTRWSNNPGTSGRANRKETPVIKKKTHIQDKSLCEIPSRFAIEMINRGWILRNEIIWHKPNCMPASVTDRFTVDFEKIYFFTKNKKYFFNQQVEETKAKVIEPRMMREEKRRTYNGKYKTYGVVRSMKRNKRTVWSVGTRAFKDAHFATFPEALIEPMIMAGCPKKGVVLDPFIGAGTTAIVALKQGKKYLGIELKKEYIKISNNRINNL